MSGTLRVIPVALVIGMLLAGGCGSKESPVPGTGQPGVVKGVLVQTVQEAPVAEEFVAAGTVRSRNSAAVAARIAGTVTSLAVREGDRVTKGRFLLAIEATEQSATAAAARAGVEEAGRGLDEARSRLALAETTYARFSTLYREEAATKQELDIRKADRDVAFQAVARAEARLEQARQGSRAAGTIAGYGRVVAPLAGVVTAKSVAVGMTVFPGMPLVTIEEEGDYRLEAMVPESVLKVVKLGQAVGVTIDGATIQGKGRVVEIVPAADPATHIFTVKIDLAGKGFRSGMFGRAGFTMASRQGLMVPKGAVVERGALTSLWVLDREHIARLRLVKLGKEQDGTVEVVSGLSPGETIVVGNPQKVTEGVRVEP
jgi:RND family efflux transporter MFP subunit